VLFWVSFVILGTFLRGPNWSFFGPFEFWDIHKLEPLVNVDLSTYFWVYGLEPNLPQNPLLRESPGILALLGWFSCSCRRSWARPLRGLVESMGVVRFNIFMHLMLWFGAAALEDAAALDREPEVHRRHPGVVLQRLRHMADRGDTHYHVRSLNAWFALSSLLLLVSALWMVIDDWKRPWKGYQRRFKPIEVARAEAQLETPEAQAVVAEETRLEGDLEKARGDRWPATRRAGRGQRGAARQPRAGCSCHRGREEGQAGQQLGSAS
jgi:hypothetical protein